ncbi:cilia- and flagella-associated protein 418 [Gouania willdenowi]|uniref:Cilia- and flagella-associated protein 418 n=1 Tax=Gouania willdenowi TaxID=441366 RepID=A0A8C5GY06_GOUWI|nr:protein C8orf37 homolog [Gouania willdenowi]
MADDDLDDLLDEVEKTFCRNVCVRGESSAVDKPTKVTDGQRTHSASKHKELKSSITDDIDALLDEFMDEDYCDTSQTKITQFSDGTHEKKKKNHSSDAGGRKCCPVFLGGSSLINGIGTSTSKRSCDQLRCISCDFRVMTFEDSEWDPSCDYLFLRNNMPDHQKLRAKLRRRRGIRAYACQCSWFSSEEPMDVRERPQLRWVCGKHQD